jgi:hypothetical protein
MTMTPHQEQQLQQARDSSVRTETLVNVILETQKEIAKEQEKSASRILKLEKSFWTLHGAWFAITSIAVFFKDKIFGGL